MGLIAFFVYNLYRACFLLLLMFIAMGLYTIAGQQRAILFVLNGGCLK